ncbi:MAG: dihydroorotate dehydrogenase [Thermofilum sp.]|nr:dihydroorotate dehydrogenase [Thermofilum sp.]
MLEVEVAGLRLRNPTVLASGVLGVSASLAKRVEEAGAGAFTTKTVTREPRRGYMNPTFVVLEHGYLNAVGLANPGIEHFCQELREMRESLSIPVILSVGGGSAEELVEVARRGVECGAQAVELNVSCPHVRGMGVELGHRADEVAGAVGEIRRLGVPVLVKLSVHHDYLRLAEACLDAGASGFTAINTVRGMAIDIYARKPILSNVYGGYSGPAIRPIAVRVVYELYEAFPGVPIIGVGGVDGWEAALELILAGASAVGVGSAIAEKDLAIFEEIVRGLKEYMEREGFSSIKELVGLAHRS